MAAVWGLICAHADLCSSIFRRTKNVPWITWFLFKYNKTTKRKLFKARWRYQGGLMSFYSSSTQITGHTPSAQTVYTSFAVWLDVLQIAFSAFKPMTLSFLLVGSSLTCLSLLCFDPAQCLITEYLFSVYSLNFKSHLCAFLHTKHVRVSCCKLQRLWF